VHVRIRPAEPSDAARLPELERAANRRFEPTGLRALFDTLVEPIERIERAIGDGTVWIAEVEGSVVGFAVGRVVGAEAHLQEVDVHPDYGRRGIGTRLVDAVLDWARERGYASVTLTTVADVAWNAPWYRSLGFEVVSADALTPALAALLDEERASGMPTEGRVVMRRRL